jgi:hypothetical protein
VESPLESALRRFLHTGRPCPRSAFNVGPVLIPSAAKSRIWSPIATPLRGASLRLFLLRKMPKGRFWIGKSVSGAFADSTQLSSAGSCVSSIFT